MMTKRQCWRVVLNINCDPTFRRSFSPTHSTPAFHLDIYFRVAARSCCSGLERYAMALSKMSLDRLKMHEITEDDRRVQMSLYEKLSAFLRAAK